MVFLIIGAGMIGQVHAEALYALQIPFYVCDSRREAALQIKNSYNALGVFSDYREAIDSGKADAVIICTPNHMHAEPAIYAMEHGLNVLCEKPAASELADAQRMLMAEKRTGQKLMIGYIMRCYPSTDYIKSLLNDGKLGRVISARCLLAAPETLTEAKTTYRKSYETGGGIIYDYSHELDYCRYFLGEPDYLAAFCGSYLNKELTVDDSADMLIHFETGILLELHMDYIQWAGRGASGRVLEIVCEHGMIETDFTYCKTFMYDGAIENVNFGPVWDDSFKEQIKRFIAITEGKDIPYASAADGLKVLEIAKEAYRSSKEHSFVYL